MTNLEDDRGRALRFTQPPRRIVSLVPSDTYTLVRLGVGDRLVGRTKYCVEPAPEVEKVPAFGGTKDPDVEAVIELRPDLVVMNQEENTRRDVERLERAGLTVMVTFPKTVRAGAGLVALLARVLGDLGDEARTLVKQAYDTACRAEARLSGPRVRTFVPIWADPLMTINGDTFISDVLAHAGAENVFADRDRKYPLAADLGRARPASPEEIAGRDVRYPRVTPEEVRERAPELVLLPDEPHAFTDEDAQVFRALDIPAAKAGRIVPVVGKHLMWPGLMSLDALEALGQMVRDVAPTS
jgi:ABC-type Fe3+-hydroxamate transport system substrate-binding protein